MSGGNEVKSDRKYTKEHEWAKLEGKELLVGITEFAVSQLGDVTLVGIDVKAGDSIEANKPFGTIESVKTLSDLYAPVTGTVTRVNAELEDKPELVNDDCWGAGWMIAIEPAQPEAVEQLLDASDYQKLLAESDQ